MDALIIKKPWIDYILEGKKVWEIRGCKTNKRGLIELIESGSGFIVGCCNINDCIQLDIDKFNNNAPKHCINTKKLPYNKTFAWVLSNAQRYNNPKKYSHPRGAIIWVKCKNEAL